MRKPKPNELSPIFTPCHSGYYESIDGTAPRTLRFVRWDDDGQTLVGTYQGQEFSVARKDYRPMQSRGTN